MISHSPRLTHMRPGDTRGRIPQCVPASGSSKRAKVSLKTKLASALLQMLRPDETGKLVPIISYDDSKLMSDEMIISLFQFDHGIAHAHGGCDEPWNLTPLTIVEHREKTAKIDLPRIGKVKRLVEPKRSTTNWPSRKIQSRGFR